MKGYNDDEIIDFIEFVKDKPVELWFIEFMPFDENKWSASKMIENIEVVNQIKAKYDL